MKKARKSLDEDPRPPPDNPIQQQFGQAQMTPDKLWIPHDEDYLPDSTAMIRSSEEEGTKEQIPNVGNEVYEQEDENMKMEEEEVVRMQKEEQVQREEEEEKARKMRKQKEEEKARKMRKQKEENIKKQKEEEEKMRKQNEEEEKMRKQNEEEERTRKQKEEEEEKAKRRRAQKQEDEEEAFYQCLRKKEEEVEKLKEQAKIAEGLNQGKESKIKEMEDEKRTLEEQIREVIREKEYKRTSADRISKLRTEAEKEGGETMRIYEDNFWVLQSAGTVSADELEENAKLVLKNMRSIMKDESLIAFCESTFLRTTRSKYEDIAMNYVNRLYKLRIQESADKVLHLRTAEDVLRDEADELEKTEITTKINSNSKLIRKAEEEHLESTKVLILLKSKIEALENQIKDELAAHHDPQFAA